MDTTTLIKPKRTKLPVRYLAYDKNCLRNGSFWRTGPGRTYSPENRGGPRRWARFINGDYIGMVEEPKAGEDPLIEYTKAQAKPLIPACCGGIQLPFIPSWR